MKRLTIALAALAGAMMAQGNDQNAAERARIREERAQAQRVYEERERECHERFAVTTCMDAARAQRRQAMERLRHEELVLDSAERKQRAAARETRVREKQIAQEAKPAPSVVPERAAAPTKARSKTPSKAPGSTTDDVVPAANATGRISEEQARRNRAAFEAKQKQAAEHRAEVERRNAERSQGSKPSAPLPVPGSASAP